MVARWETVGRVRICDASSLFRKDRAQNRLERGHAERISGWYHTF